MHSKELIEIEISVEDIELHNKTFKLQRNNTGGNYIKQPRRE